MADKIILNLGKQDGSTAKIILDNEARTPLFGMKVGQEFDGEIINDDLKGYKLKITGGSNEDGTPMRRDLDMAERKRILFKGRTAGYKPKSNEKGIRKRKLVRGNEIQDDIVQLNIKVLEEGKTPLQ